MNSPHQGQWRRALMFSLICVWINDWVNNRQISLHSCQCVLIAKKLTSVSTAVLPGGHPISKRSNHFIFYLAVWRLREILLYDKTSPSRFPTLKFIKSVPIILDVVSYHSMMDDSELVLRYNTLMRLQWSVPITWSQQIGRLSINWGPFHFRGIYCNWNSMEMSFYSHPNSNQLSSKKRCARHERWVLRCKSKPLYWYDNQPEMELQHRNWHQIEILVINR